MKEASFQENATFMYYPFTLNIQKRRIQKSYLTFVYIEFLTIKVNEYIECISHSIHRNQIRKFKQEIDSAVQ